VSEQSEVCAAERTSGERVHEVLLCSAGGLACGIVGVALRAARHSLREWAGSSLRSARTAGTAGTCLESDRTLYASLMPLKRSSEPPRSGCAATSKLRYARRICAT